jgi:hypothetical protein
MIISRTSWGSLSAGDKGVIEVFGEASPDHILRIMARVRYQIRLMSSSITVSSWSEGCRGVDGVITG